MKTKPTRARIDRLVSQALAQRLSTAVTPLQRAQAKQAAGVRLDLWSDAELHALAEHLAPGSVARAHQHATAEAERIIGLPTADLLTMRARLSRPGDREREPQIEEQRWHAARHLAEVENGKLE